MPRQTPPSPSQLRLDTSPPDGGEDMQAADLAPILSPHEVGERCRGEAETERGAGQTRSRRKPGTTKRARALRWTENDAEGVLWQELRSRRLGGYHFIRQLPVGPYFADFCCRKAKLVIEVDGSQHVYSLSDRRRDDYMRSAGYSVLRFWRDDVLKQRLSVCDTILAALCGRLGEDVVAPDLRFAYTTPPPSAGAS